MKFHMIDYVKVCGNQSDGWRVRYSRLARNMFRCRTDKPCDILQAMHSWGVLRNATDYKVVPEGGGQLTIFELGTDKPVCGIFRTVD